MQRKAALLAHPFKQSTRPRHGSDHAKERNELPPPTRAMLSLGIDRASMAQGGKP